MSIQIADTSVRTAIDVDVPIERAFSVFTEGIGTWWPPDHHILKAELEEMVFETHVGGNVYDRGVDGSECRWARVLVYDPPHRVMISWDINTSWEIETDPEKTSEVDVTFSERGPNLTHVELEHRALDRHGEGWEAIRDAVGSPGGWNLTHYAETAKAAP
ncbi:MAG: SRPBCC family protein [Solirubrobacterales bacterium]|nr:SRPBCC family protein [Solirubrobacterales bacterium]